MPVTVGACAKQDQSPGRIPSLTKKQDKRMQKPFSESLCPGKLHPGTIRFDPALPQPLRVQAGFGMVNGCPDLWLGPACPLLLD